MDNPIGGTPASESPALTAARERGMVYVRGELSLDSNLLEEDAAQLAGLSVADLLARRSAGDFYAFQATADRLRFPRWQFAVPQEGLRVLIQAFANKSVWALHLFTSRPNMYLGDRSPREHLTQPDYSVESLRRAVSYRLCEHQGGS